MFSSDPDASYNIGETYDINTVTDRMRRQAAKQIYELSQVTLKNKGVPDPVLITRIGGLERELVSATLTPEQSRAYISRHEGDYSRIKQYLVPRSAILVDVNGVRGIRQASYEGENEVIVRSSDMKKYMIKEAYEPHTYALGHHPNQYVKGMGRAFYKVGTPRTPYDIEQELDRTHAYGTRNYGDTSWEHYNKHVIELKKVVPGIEIDEGLGAPDRNKTATNAVMDQIVELSKTYPNIANKIVSLNDGWGLLKDSELMATGPIKSGRPGRSELFLGPMMLESEDVLEGVIKETNDYHFFWARNPAEVMTHEFGHVIQNVAERNHWLLPPAEEDIFLANQAALHQPYASDTTEYSKYSPGEYLAEMFVKGIVNGEDASQNKAIALANLVEKELAYEKKLTAGVGIVKEDTYTPHTYIQGHHPNQYVHGMGPLPKTVKLRKLSPEEAAKTFGSVVGEPKSDVEITGDFLKETDSAKTVEDVAAALKKQWNPINPKIEIDYTDIDIDNAKSLNKAAYNFMRAYPEDAAHLDYYGRDKYVTAEKYPETYWLFNRAAQHIDNNPTNIYAVAPTEGRHGIVLFNVIAFRKPADEVDQGYRFGVSTGFHPPTPFGAAYTVATHELGHILEHGATESEAYNTWQKHISNYSKSGYTEPAYNYVSQYARTSELEKFAETFADVELNGLRKDAPYDAEVMDAFLKRYKTEMADYRAHYGFPGTEDWNKNTLGVKTEVQKAREFQARHPLRPAADVIKNPNSNIVTITGPFVDVRSGPRKEVNEALHKYLKDDNREVDTYETIKLNKGILGYPPMNSLWVMNDGTTYKGTNHRQMAQVANGEVFPEPEQDMREYTGWPEVHLMDNTGVIRVNQTRKEINIELRQPPTLAQLGALGRIIKNNPGEDPNVVWEIEKPDPENKGIRHGSDTLAQGTGFANFRRKLDELNYIANIKEALSLRKLNQQEIEHYFGPEGAQYAKDQRKLRLGTIWSLNPAHKIPCLCEDYVGFYPAGTHVPARPHPNCFCSITRMAMVKVEPHHINRYREARAYAPHTYARGHHPNQYIQGIGALEHNAYNVGITSDEFQQLGFGEKVSSVELNDALGRLGAKDVHVTVAKGGWKNDEGKLFQENALSLQFQDGAVANVNKEMAHLGEEWNQEAVLVQEYAKGGEPQAVIDFGRQLDTNEITQVSEAIKQYFGGWTFAVENHGQHTNLIVSSIGEWGGPPEEQFLKEVRAVSDELPGSSIVLHHTRNYPLDTRRGRNVSDGNKESRRELQKTGFLTQSRIQRGITRRLSEYISEARGYQAHTYAQGHHPNQYIRGVGSGVGGQKVWNGNSVHVEDEPQTNVKGDIGERIAVAWLQQNGWKGAERVNIDTPNFPIDIADDSVMVAEAKAGSVMNGAKAQWWRFTIGEPGPKEKAMMAKMKPQELAAWNKKKQQDIVVRKNAELARMEKEKGHSIKAYTITSIINNDTHMADVFVFEGFHERIYWKNAASAYVGTFKYG